MADDMLSAAVCVKGDDCDIKIICLFSHAVDVRGESEDGMCCTNLAYIRRLQISYYQRWIPSSFTESK
jgi:hypothetical protein